MRARNAAILMAAGLGACAGPAARNGLDAAAPPAPRPAEGLWAILDPGCGKPSLADPRTWPRCASPFWISRNSAVVVRSKPAPDQAGAQASYRASFHLAPGVPLIAQIGNRKDGYLFLALTQLDRDSQGRLVAATGAAFACAAHPGDGVSAVANHGGCEGQPETVVRLAAERTLADPSVLARVAWIAPGAPTP